MIHKHTCRNMHTYTKSKIKYFKNIFKIPITTFTEVEKATLKLVDKDNEPKYPKQIKQGHQNTSSQVILQSQSSKNSIVQALKSRRVDQ